jgi:hypothetical protein
MEYNTVVIRDHQVAVASTEAFGFVCRSNEGATEAPKGREKQLKCM